MPFKLLSYVLSVSFWLLPSNLKAAAPDVLAYKGNIFSLSGRSIEAMAVRSDGRYLFYSTGAASFTVLDLLDMARTSETFATDAAVVGIFMDGDSRLMIATTKGIQYYNVSKPLKPAVETTAFVRPSVDSGLSVSDACSLGSQRVALLEKSSGTTNLHKIRIVTGTNFVVSPPWSSISGGQPSRNPVAIRCSGSSVYVASFESTQSFDTATSIYFSALSPEAGLVVAASEFQISSSYRVTDFVLSEKQDQILILFNRATQLNLSDDSVVMAISSSLSAATSFSLGSGAKAISTFKEGAGFIAGFFVGVDRLSNLSDNQDKFLVGSLPFAGQIQEDRGAGSNLVGARRPSLWVSTKDDYKYGITESTGVSLIGRGPNVEVTEGPAVTALTASQPLQFKLRADRDTNYSIFFDQTFSLDGTSSGLSREPGILIKSGNLLKDVETSLEVSAAELGVAANRIHSISITAHDSSLGASVAPLTRLGIGFNFDPAPGPVRNLRLSFGDSAIFVNFDPPVVEDIENYLIHFSYTASDLNDPLLETPRTFVSGVNDRNLISPVAVNALEFGGTHIITPVKNGLPVYVRVYAVDKTDQRGEVSPLISRTAYRTLTIEEALGAANSCALAAHRPISNPGGVMIHLLNILIALAFLKFWRNLVGEKIGPSTSRNRRGGD